MFTTDTTSLKCGLDQSLSMLSNKYPQKKLEGKKIRCVFTQANKIQNFVCITTDYKMFRKTGKADIG